MGRFGMTTGRSYCGISGSPKRMEYTVQGDVVYLSAWLMAKSPALGSFRSRSRARPAQWQFRAAAPASFGVHRGHAEAKICPPWYGNILDGSVITACDVPGAMKDRVVQLCGVTGWPEIKQVQELLGGAVDKAL